jgi:hypothetical protein
LNAPNGGYGSSNLPKCDEKWKLLWILLLFVYFGGGSLWNDWRHSFMDGIPNGSDISGPMSISLNSTFNLLITKRVIILW